MTDSENRQHNEDVYEISLLDLLVILVKQRKFIIKTTALFAVVSIIYALCATPIYKSQVMIMPPAGAATSSLLAATGLSDLLGAGAFSTPSDTIVGLTKSPAVLDRVIDKNHLLTRKPEGWSLTGSIKALFSSGAEGKPKLRTLVRTSLANSIQSAADKKSGIVTVFVSDTSQDLAPKLATSVYEETLAVMQQVAITPTAQQRAFLEQQLKQNNKDLVESEQAMINFQKKTGMIGGAGGAPNDVAALASLQARMVAKEIELRSARRFATSANPQVKRLEAEYSAIKRQFQIDSGKIGTAPLSGVGVSNLPSASMEYATLFREFKFREALNQMLMRQYETAKINEVNDPMVIQKIGDATYPELRDSPKRSKIVVLATLLGGFLGVFIAFIRHFMSLSVADPETAPKIDYIKKTLLSMIPFRRPR